MIHADLRLSSHTNNPFVHVVTDEQLHPDIDNNEYDNDNKNSNFSNSIYMSERDDI